MPESGYRAIQPGARRCAPVKALEMTALFEQLVQLAVNGLITGSILALTGVGASLVFGIQRVANFAHGDYLTIGAYVALIVNIGFHQNLIIAAVCGMLATALFAVV